MMFDLPSLPIRRIFLLLLVVVATIFVTSESTFAHAELVETDPPINGLVIAPPDHLTLRFTEDVAADNPAPTVRVLDDQGNEQAVTIQPPAGRELLVDLPSLRPGVWTVSWSVRSATDGHQLSGTYAFRVGGGLPAGAATTSGEIPDAWAVVARWLTFLGAAVAAAGFLFGFLDRQDRLPPRRLGAIITGGTLALVATLAEPILLTLDPPNGSSITYGEALRSLPDAWWIRPPSLALAVLVAVFSLYARRRTMPDWLALLGGLLGLGALLGMSLTSHAAGRDSWRAVAVAVDMLHQWSVALWVGGLVHIVLTWPSGDPDSRKAVLQRFSRLALVLFVVGVGTGITNAGFAFPALDLLWNSNYGFVLIAKVAVLLVPLGLAIYHRRVIAVARQLPQVLRLTLRIEVIATVAVLLGGATLALSAPPVEEQTGPDYVTLFQFETNENNESVGLVHLRISPVVQGDNEIVLWLTDTQGNPPAGSTVPRVSLNFTSLDHGTVSDGINLIPTDPASQRYEAKGLDLSLDGWWQIDATIDHDESAATRATFYVLLPDPNIHGSSAAPAPDNDSAARAVFDRGVNAMQSMQKFRWTEHINTGDDTMVLVNFSQIASAAGQPMAVEQLLAYSGSFATRADGSLPPPPTTNTYHSATIGDRAWLIQNDGMWLEQPAGRFGAIADWGSIYDQAEYLRLGGTTEIDGERVQIVTFHTPDEAGQSEAWFSWWVGADTGRIYRVTMVARSHYMVWTYSDFNGEFQIGPPPPGSTEPEATPRPG